MLIRLLSYFFVIIISTSTLQSNELVVNSDILEVNSKKRVSVFFGNVFAEEESLQIRSEKLTVKLKDNKDIIRELIAEDNVILKKNDITAKSKKAIYLVEDEILKLYGDVEVIENNNILTGDEFLLDLLNSTSIMKSNNLSRVKATINNQID